MKRNGCDNPLFTNTIHLKSNKFLHRITHQKSCEAWRYIMIEGIPTFSKVKHFKKHELLNDLQSYTLIRIKIEQARLYIDSCYNSTIPQDHFSFWTPSQCMRCILILNVTSSVHSMKQKILMITNVTEKKLHSAVVYMSLKQQKGIDANKRSQGIRPKLAQKRSQTQ